MKQKRTGTKYLGNSQPIHFEKKRKEKRREEKGKEKKRKTKRKRKKENPCSEENNEDVAKQLFDKELSGGINRGPSQLPPQKPDAVLQDQGRITLDVIYRSSGLSLWFQRGELSLHFQQDRWPPPEVTRE